MRFTQAGMGLVYKMVHVAYAIVSEPALNKQSNEANGADCGELQQRRPL
jgi:hypothetical protein